MSGSFDDMLDLRDLLPEIVDNARFEAECKHCAIELDIDGAGLVRGSHELLYRAIENVVRNAVLYSPEGGHILISARTMDDHLRLAVADNGAGVPERDLAAIFDPFNRSVSGRLSAGYGLGLAITRRVVEAHGGAVHAANRPEGGLVVEMKLNLNLDSELPEGRAI